MNTLPAGNDGFETSPWPVLEDAALHGPAGEVVHRLEPHTEADPAALLFTFLAFYGNALGPGPHGHVDGADHPPRLNVLLVGKTSRARKGTTASRIRQVFREADETWTGERIKGGLGSGEGLISDLAGEEDRRLLVLEEEFARMLAVAGRDGSTLSSILRQAWDSAELRVITRKNGLHVDGAYVSVLSHITLEELRNRLLDVEVANGLANRFLFVCVERKKLLPMGGNLEPAELELLGGMVRHALKRAARIGRVNFSSEAFDPWCELYRRLDAEAAGGLAGAATARAEAQCFRLAVTYALLDGSRTIVPNHVAAAAAAWRYCDTSARHIFGDATGDQVADRLLAELRRRAPDGLDHTEQSDLFAGHCTKARLARARTELCGLGLAREVTVPTKGRPRTITYAVPPGGISDISGKRPSSALPASSAKRNGSLVAAFGLTEEVGR